jgi:transcriptional regulator GlxA family with amidase domain
MSTTAQLPRDELTAGSEPPTGPRRHWGRFALHYLEMVVAMLVGMFVLGGALRAVLAVAGVEYSIARFPELVIVEMGLTMALGMAAWMRYRGHGWPATLEMSAAMLVPAVAFALLVWLDLLDGGSAMMLEHTVMFPLMLLVMLRRLDEYAVAHGRPRRAVRSRGRRRVLRTLGLGVVALLAFFLLPAGVLVAGSSAYERSRYAPSEDATAAAAAIAAATPPVHDPGRPTAVVVVGNSGANIADTLVPYEVLSGTGAFNVYTVAAERRLVPLLGGLDLVPDLSFAELGERLGGAAPDVTVVPDMPSDESSDAAVTAWLRDTASDGLLLGVCTGARLLAEAGLLDGRQATSHWFRLGRLQEAHPEVHWQRGLRYVDEGDVITTGGLLSSIDGTLRVVERLVDADAAAAAAQAVGWRYYSAGTAAVLPESRLGPSEAILHLLNLGFRANATNVGVVLTEGVGELELAAAFDPYAEVKSARTLAIAADDGSIRSRHGLTFVPRADLDAASRVDRLLVPGADAAANPAPEVAAAADRADVPVAYLHGRPGFAFDPALEDMAGTMDAPTARWTAKILEYPTAELGLSGPSGPWAPALSVLALGLLGLATVAGAARLVGQARTRRS